jgi:hypothetical protein
MAALLYKTSAFFTPCDRCGAHEHPVLEIVLNKKICKYVYPNISFPTLKFII